MKRHSPQPHLRFEYARWIKNGTSPMAVLVVMVGAFELRLLSTVGGSVAQFRMPF